jgi:hypothetical protein
MRIRLAIFLTLPVVLLAACDLDEVIVTGSGDIVTKEEDLSGFERVDASDSFEVDIQQGESYSVVIRIDDNLQDDLEVLVRDGTLEIGFARNIITNNATMEADITMPQLRGVGLSGASEARVTGFESSRSFSVDLSGSSSISGVINADDVSLELSGSSNADLKGSGNDLEIDASGASEIDLSKFPVEDAVLKLSGSSQVIVNLNGTLDVNASGSSDVTYLGSPALGDIQTSGSSSVSRE